MNITASLWLVSTYMQLNKTEDSLCRTLWLENNLPMFQLDALVTFRAKVKLGVKTCTYLQLHTQGYMTLNLGYLPSTSYWAIKNITFFDACNCAKRSAVSEPMYFTKISHVWLSIDMKCFFCPLWTCLYGVKGQLCSGHRPLCVIDLWLLSTSGRSREDSRSVFLSFTSRSVSYTHLTLPTIYSV